MLEMTTLQFFSEKLPIIVPLLMWLVGAVLSLNNLKRHPKLAAFSLAGCIILLISTVFPLVQSYLNVSMRESSRGIDELQQWGRIMLLIQIVLNVTGFALLLMAFLAYRRGTGGSVDVTDTAAR
jgi:hypothetical protein